MTDQLLIAQLTDTHVVGSDNTEELYVDNNDRLAQAVASINGESPTIDAVVVTGDLTNTGTQPEYDQLVSTLAGLEPPVLALPGNHDVRDRVRASFPDVPWVDQNHASWVVTVGKARIVGLDSTIPGEPGAEFDTQRAAWLRGVLSEAHDGPTILAMHHPPFATGIEWMDNAGFIGLEGLDALLTELPVDRIICGHLHRPIVGAIAGITAQVGLSTVQHVDLDLAPAAPLSLILDPPGYQIHRLVDPSGHAPSMVTHTRLFETGNQGFIPSWADEDS